MGDSFSVRPLRSGSSGNLTLVTHAGTILLVDAGLSSQRGLAQALAEGGLRMGIDLLDILHPAGLGK